MLLSNFHIVLVVIVFQKVHIFPLWVIIHCQIVCEKVSQKPAWSLSMVCTAGVFRATIGGPPNLCAIGCFLFLFVFNHLSPSIHILSGTLAEINRSTSSLQHFFIIIFVFSAKRFGLVWCGQITHSGRGCMRPTDWPSAKDIFSHMVMLLCTMLSPWSDHALTLLPLVRA